MPPVHGIRPPAPVYLDFNPADNWKLFKQKWKNYATKTQLQKQSADYQVALLLHTIGDAALKIHNGFTFETEDESRSVAAEINECYKRFVFHNINQQHSETFEQFLTATRMLIKSCNFGDACRNSTLRDIIVLGVYDCDVQEALLKQRNISLETTIDMCRVAEHARSQSKVVRPEAVNKVGKSRYIESNKGSFDNKMEQKPTSANECAKPPTKNYQMEHPTSSADSRVTLTEYVQQMGRPATVANQIISRKFVGEKHVKADIYDKSNQTRVEQIWICMDDAQSANE